MDEFNFKTQSASTDSALDRLSMFCGGFQTGIQTRAPLQEESSLNVLSTVAEGYDVNATTYPGCSRLQEFSTKQVDPIGSSTFDGTVQGTSTDSVKCPGNIQIGKPLQKVSALKLLNAAAEAESRPTNPLRRIPDAFEATQAGTEGPSTMDWTKQGRTTDSINSLRNVQTGNPLLEEASSKLSSTDAGAYDFRKAANSLGSLPDSLSFTKTQAETVGSSSKDVTIQGTTTNSNESSGNVQTGNPLQEETSLKLSRTDEGTYDFSKTVNPLWRRPNEFAATQSETEGFSTIEVTIQGTSSSSVKCSGNFQTGNQLQEETSLNCRSAPAACNVSTAKHAETEGSSEKDVAIQGTSTNNAKISRNVPAGNSLQEDASRKLSSTVVAACDDSAVVSPMCRPSNAVTATQSETVGSSTISAEDFKSMEVEQPFERCSLHSPLPPRKKRKQQRPLPALKTEVQQRSLPDSETQDPQGKMLSRENQMVQSSSSPTETISTILITHLDALHPPMAHQLWCLVPLIRNYLFASIPLLDLNLQSHPFLLSYLEMMSSLVSNHVQTVLLLLMRQFKTLESLLVNGIKTRWEFYVNDREAFVPFITNTIQTVLPAMANNVIALQQLLHRYVEDLIKELAVNSQTMPSFVDSQLLTIATMLKFHVENMSPLLNNQLQMLEYLMFSRLRVLAELLSTHL